MRAFSSRATLSPCLHPACCLDNLLDCLRQQSLHAETAAHGGEVCTVGDQGLPDQAFAWRLWHQFAWLKVDQLLGSSSGVTTQEDWCKGTRTTCY